MPIPKVPDMVVHHVVKNHLAGVKLAPLRSISRVRKNGRKQQREHEGKPGEFVVKNAHLGQIRGFKSDRKGIN
jgi:hypothetical protein